MTLPFTVRGPFPASLLVCAFIAMAASAPAQCAGLKINASDAASLDEYGSAVAMDGGTIVVGARLDDDGGAEAGSAYLIDAASGAELFKLVAGDGAADDRFGSAVAIDGNSVVVGSIRDDDNGADSGSAYLFNATTGAQTFKLTPTDGSGNDNFGTAVAVSGTTVVVGAPFDDDNGVDSGSAYLFDASTGMSSMKLTPSDGAAGDTFGAAVAIDGTTVIVSAPRDDVGGGDSGSVYVFDATTGMQMMKFTASDGAAGDNFGHSVAIDGSSLVVGARLDGDNGSESGSAYLFDLGTGLETFKLLPADGAAFDEFGIAVAIDGASAVIGARLDDDVGSNSGSAYAFDVATGAELGKIIAADGAADDLFGTAVATEGVTVVVAAPQDDDGATGSGSAYLFDALNRFPGTSEDLVMESTVNGVGGSLVSCKDALVGDQLVIRFLSATGTFDFTLPLLLAQAYFPSAPPSPVFPGIAVDPGIVPGPVLLFGGGTPGNPFTQLLLPPGGIAVGALVPPQLSGIRVLFQAYALTGLANNGSFASTEGHVANVL